jgi:hypothetical protein
VKDTGSIALSRKTEECQRVCRREWFLREALSSRGFLLKGG